MVTYGQNILHSNSKEGKKFLPLDVATHPWGRNFAEIRRVNVVKLCCFGEGCKVQSLLGDDADWGKC